MTTTMTPTHHQQQDRRLSQQARPVWRPAADIYETDTAYLIRLDVPGADADSIDITLEDQVLTITARNTLELPEGARPVLREFIPADYRRTFTVGDVIDSDGIEADIADGVLTVTLNKAAAHQPKRIAVRAR